MAPISFVRIDITEASFEIPSGIQRQIGNAIIQFSSLETISEMLIWDLLQLGFEDGQTLISKQDASRKFQVLQEVIKRHVPTDVRWFPTASTWRAIRITTEARNKIAHGAWVMYEGVPFVISHRWKGPLGEVVGESFPYERIESAARLTKKLTERLRRLYQELGLRHAATAQPRSTATATATRLPNPESHSSEPKPPRRPSQR